MKSRLDYFAAAPESMRAMLSLEHHVRNSGLEHSLIHLVKTRASQINGCAFCVHMHTRDARTAGETEERLYLLSAWRESPLYTPRERAALAWTESLTLIAESRASDEDNDLVGTPAVAAGTPARLQQCRRAQAGPVRLRFAPELRSECLAPLHRTPTGALSP